MAVSVMRVTGSWKRRPARRGGHGDSHHIHGPARRVVLGHIKGAAPMTRFCYLLMLMVVSSSAYAGEALSFVIGGHRVHIEASDHCHSASCVSVSIPGIYQTRRKHDRDDDVEAIAEAAPAKPPAPQSAATRPAAPPASNARLEP